MQQRDIDILAQLLAPEGGGSLANRLAANTMAQNAAAQRKRKMEDVPAIPDPVNTTQKSFWGRAWDAIPDAPEPGTPRGDGSDYGPQRRAPDRGPTAYDDPGISDALNAQGRGPEMYGPPPPSNAPPAGESLPPQSPSFNIDPSIMNAAFQTPSEPPADGLSPADVGGMPRPTPRPGNVPTRMADVGGSPAMKFDPAAIRASLGQPAMENAPGTGTSSMPADTAAPQQYGPPKPTPHDLLYQMAMGGEGKTASQTANMENIALALMMGGLGTMAEASKPNASAMGSFGSGNTQGLQTLMTLNQVDQRNSRYNNRDQLGALTALSNIENAQATRENTSAYRDAMLEERAADRAMRGDIARGSQDLQNAQLASLAAYRQAMLGMRGQELDALKGYRDRSLDLQSKNTLDGVTPEMKAYAWAQDRAMAEAKLFATEPNYTGESVVNPEKYQKAYDTLLPQFLERFGGNASTAGPGPQAGSGGGMDTQIPQWAPEGAEWKPDPQTGEPILVVKQNGKWMKVVPKSQPSS